MNVKCFACEAQIVADDADAATDAFVTHGHETHTWPYPEEAIRNPTYRRHPSCPSAHGARHGRP